MRARVINVVLATLVAAVIAMRGAAGEPASPSPLESAKKLAASEKRSERVKALRIFKQLSTPGTKSGDEATYRYAELCLRFHAEGEKSALSEAKKAFANLQKSAGSRWGLRGKIGLYRVMAAEGKRAEAIKGLDRFLGQQTKCERAVEAAYYLGCLYAEKKDDVAELKKAQRALGYALALHKSVAKYTPPLVSAKTIAARLAWVKKRIWEHEAGRLKVLFAKAEKLRKAKKYKAALTVYREIVKESPEHVIAQHSGLRIGQCFFAMGKHNEGKLHLERFVSKQPLGAYRGHAHLVLGDFWLEHQFRAACAEAEYSAILTPAKYVVPDPAKTKGFWNPALSAKLLRVRADKTIPFEDPLAAEAAKTKDPARRIALLRAARPKGAHDSWKEVLPDAHSRLGIVCYMRADFKAADKNFATCYQMRPEESLGRGVPQGVLLLCELCRKRELPVPAAYLTVGSDRVRVCLFLAGAYTEGAGAAKAVKLFARVAGGDLSKEAHPEQRAYALCYQGEALWRADKGDEAQKLWGKFMKGPDSQRMVAPRALLKLGCTKFTETQKAKDLKILERVYTMYPNSEAAPLALFQHAMTRWAYHPREGIKLLLLLKQRYPNCIHKGQVTELLPRFKKRARFIEKWRAEQARKKNAGG